MRWRVLYLHSPLGLMPIGTRGLRHRGTRDTCPAASRARIGPSPPLPSPSPLQGREERGERRERKEKREGRGERRERSGHSTVRCIRSTATMRLSRGGDRQKTGEAERERQRPRVSAPRAQEVRPQPPEEHLQGLRRRGSDPNSHPSRRVRLVDRVPRCL